MSKSSSPVASIQPRSNMKRALRVAAVAGLLIVPSIAHSYMNPVAEFKTGDTVNASDFNSIFGDIYGALNELESQMTGVIDADTKWTVGSSGDFATLDDALAAAGDYRIAHGATLTLELLEETHTLTEEQDIAHAQGAQLEIVGNLEDPTKVVVSCAADSSCLRVKTGTSLGLVGGITFSSPDAVGYAVELVASTGKIANINVDKGAGAVLATGGAKAVTSNISVVGSTFGANVQSGAVLNASAWDVDSTLNHAFYVDFGGRVILNTVSVTNAGGAGVNVANTSAAYVRTMTVDGGSGGFGVGGGSVLNGRGLNCIETSGDCLSVGHGSEAVVMDFECTLGSSCVEAQNRGSVTLLGTIKFTDVDATAFHVNRQGRVWVTYGNMTFNGDPMLAKPVLNTHWIASSGGTVDGNSN